jgi:hypothetical protein
VVDDVAGGEYSRDVDAGGRGFDFDLAIVV